MSDPKDKIFIPDQTTPSSDHSVSTDHGVFDSVDLTTESANNVRNSMPAPDNRQRGGEQRSDKKSE